MSGLAHIFSYLCGSDHRWALGGEVLPFCQRCTGLYVGGVLAFLLYLLFRPRPTWRVLALHGLLLVQMAPFGYHWVAQNGAVRTLTGQLFAFGLVYYLMLNPTAQLDLWEKSRKDRLLLCALVGLLSLPALQLAVHLGGLATGAVLAWAGFAGLLIYAALTVANLVALPRAIWGLFRRPQGA
jgi:uncharacterized membrane protein